MENSYDQMIKRPLLMMKIQFSFYKVVTAVCVILFLLTFFGEPYYPMLTVITLFAAITLIFRHGHSELMKGTKSGWVISMIMSALSLTTLFLPWAVWAITGLMDKSVRSRCLDSVDENQLSPVL